MPEYLDIETWTRRSHFDLFKTYDNPYFNIGTSVDVTPLLNLTRANKNISFFIAYHFLSIKAANEVEPFRYRLQGERVLVYERIHAGTIILLPDESFTFAYFDYDENFEAFHTNAKATIDRALTGGPRLDERASRDDLIHHSVVPWITFTSVSHARKRGQDDSVPKIAFGKYGLVGDRVMMPVSVEVHHALMDGLHVGRYLSRFETYLADPRAALGLSS